MQNRYSRQITLPQIGPEGQKKFQSAKVLVVGAGGLGCPVLQYLSAAGIGTIGIIDFDVVDETNLHRQILFSVEDICKSKAACAKQKITLLNPDAKIQSYTVALTAENALEIISGYDIVVDGSDNFQTRYLVNDACVIAGKPFVFGSVFQFEGQVSVFNYKNGPTYRCLYPESGDLPSCAEAGVLGVVPGTIGCIMAAETLKIISGSGNVLSGKLLVYNSLQGAFTSFSFLANEENKKIKSLHPIIQSYVPEMSVENLKKRISLGETITIIDVREPHEYAEKNISGVLIPFGMLEKNLHLIPKNNTVVIHCQGGGRSRKAVQILLDNGYDNVSSLAGGMKEYLENAE